MSDGYNGWTNYETWNVALWLDNEQGSYGYWTEAAEQAVNNADGDKDDAAIALAGMLESEHKDAMPEVTGVFADLLGAALDAVNWREIAEHYVSDVEVENEESDA